MNHLQFALSSFLGLIIFSFGYAQNDLKALGFDTSGISLVTIKAAPVQTENHNEPTVVRENHQLDLKERGGQDVNMTLSTYSGNGVLIYDENQQPMYQSIQNYYPVGIYDESLLFGPNQLLDYDTVPAYYQTPYYRNMMR